MYTIPPLRRRPNDRQNGGELPERRALARPGIDCPRRHAHPPPQLRDALPQRGAVDQRRGRPARTGPDRLPLPADRDRRRARPARHRLRHRGRAQPAASSGPSSRSAAAGRARRDGADAGRGARLRRRRRPADRHHPPRPRPLPAACPTSPTPRSTSSRAELRRGAWTRACATAPRYLPRALEAQPEVGRARRSKATSGSASRACASCPTSTPRSLLIPLAGHTARATPASRSRRGDGWLLHCGDAYFHHDELASPPSCPPGLRFFQSLNHADTAPAPANQERLRELVAAPRRRGAAALLRTTRRSWTSHRPPATRPRRERRAAREPLGATRRAGRALAADRLHALARGRARARLRRLRRALALVGRRPRGVLAAIWDFFEVQADGDREPGRSARREMPGAEWFPGARLNYAEHVFAGKDDDEVGDPPRLRAARARRAHLGRAARPGRRGRRRPARARGRARATASSPTCRTSPRRSSPSSPPPASARSGRAARPTSAPASVDRPLRPDRAEGAVRGRRLPLRRQGLRPPRDRRRAAGGDAEPRAHRRPPLPRPRLPTSAPLDATRSAGTSCSPPARAPSSTFERVPFDHPLWVLYSSGTTGLPKAIVQGQGGILLEQLKKLHLHLDAQPGDRLFWFTTTGWMMWNFLVSGLLTRGRDRPLRRQPRLPRHGRPLGPRRAGRDDDASAPAPPTSPPA